MRRHKIYMNGVDDSGKVWVNIALTVPLHPDGSEEQEDFKRCLVELYTELSRLSKMVTGSPLTFVLDKQHALN